MIDELNVLQIVVKRLESAGVPYMVTGSIAANFYTTPRMTRDIDIVIAVGEEDARPLYALFSHDFYVDYDAIRNAIRGKQIFNIIHKEGIVKVDFITRKDAEYRQIEFQRGRSVYFEGCHVRITTPEDLVISKLVWAKDSSSEMQARDIRNIMRTVVDLDMGYIENWIKRLGLEEIYKFVTSG